MKAPEDPCLRHDAGHPGECTCPPEDPTAGEPRIVTDGVYEISMRNPVTVELAELHGIWRRHEGGHHAWVIAAFFEVADPERALDVMELTEANLIGFNPIHCLFCGTIYTSEFRFAHCTGKAGT